MTNKPKLTSLSSCEAETLAHELLLEYAPLGRFNHSSAAEDIIRRHYDVSVLDVNYLHQVGKVTDVVEKAFATKIKINSPAGDSEWVPCYLRCTDGTYIHAMHPDAAELRYMYCGI